MTARRRFLAAAVLSTACVTASLAATGSATAGPGHEDPGSGDVTTYDGPLALMGPEAVVARRYGKRAYVDLQVRALAGAGDLEVRSNRRAVKPYGGPITTTWTLGDQSGAFPVDTQQGFSGLPDLLRVAYRDADGSTVARQSLDACLNGGSQRIQPGGDPRNAYPYSPFTLGSVQGIQDGWATRLSSWGSTVRLPVGHYTATVRVAGPYAKAWGLDREDIHVDVPVTIREPRRNQGGWWRARNAATAPRTLATAAPEDVPAHPAAREPSAEAADLPPGTPMPDLRSLPAFDIGLNGKGTLIRFAANVWNGGNSPLVIDGFRTADEDVMAAYQYFFDADGEQVAYQPVERSGFYWHAENHDHWHFEDFARYQLLDAGREVLKDSGKVSFCLANTDAVDYTVDGADWRPGNTDLSTSCGRRGSLSVREVLSAGSGDTYEQYRAGQVFGGIKNLDDGRYFVRVHANPNDALVESDTTNNVQDRRITLGTRKNCTRLVRAAQVGLIDEDAGFGWFSGRTAR